VNSSSPPPPVNQVPQPTECRAFTAYPERMVLICPPLTVRRRFLSLDFELLLVECRQPTSILPSRLTFRERSLFSSELTDTVQAASSATGSPSPSSQRDDGQIPLARIPASPGRCRPFIPLSSHPPRLLFCSLTPPRENRARALLFWQNSARRQHPPSYNPSCGQQKTSFGFQNDPDGLWIYGIGLGFVKAGERTNAQFAIFDAVSEWLWCG
jgi:hypothetical protein